MLTPKQKSERHVTIWRKSIPGRGNNQCKGSGVGASLAHLRNLMSMQR